MGASTIEVVADKGYFKSEEIARCEADGIEVYVPKSPTSNARARGRFDRSEFIYDRKSDTYICPANERLTSGNAPSSTYLTQVRKLPSWTSFSDLQATVHAWQPMQRE